MMQYTMFFTLIMILFHNFIFGADGTPETRADLFRKQKMLSHYFTQLKKHAHASKIHKHLALVEPLLRKSVSSLWEGELSDSEDEDTTSAHSHIHTPCSRTIDEKISAQAMTLLQAMNTHMQECEDNFLTIIEDDQDIQGALGTLYKEKKLGVILRCVFEKLQTRYSHDLTESTRINAEAYTEFEKINTQLCHPARDIKEELELDADLYKAAQKARIQGTLCSVLLSIIQSIKKPAPIRTPPVSAQEIDPPRTQRRHVVSLHAKE